MKTCCTIGLREIPAEKAEYIKQELRREVLAAVDDGYTHFLSGFDEGTDLLFASIVVELKREDESLWLEAAIPFRSRVESPDPAFKELLGQCKSIGIHSETDSPDCYIRCRRNMVSESQRVIAVCDKQEQGDTADILRYACSQEKEVRTIKI